MAEATVTFWSPSAVKLVQETVIYDSTLGPDMIAIRQAAQDHARDQGHTWWAQDHGGERFLVYALEGRLAAYRGHFPTMAAAEMYVLHHAAAR